MNAIQERVIQTAEDYNQAAKRRECIMRRDVTVSAWLASHTEFLPGASIIASGLYNLFEKTTAEVFITIQSDPEMGSEKLLFEVRTSLPGREARKIINHFVTYAFPPEALALRESMIFSVTGRPSK